jgi:two-component system alkaline phosphatase synthesis response regulator PhoP
VTEVLVVEDDPAIRRGLVDALSFAGHRVRETDDGLDALRLVERAVPDLVLLDVMLPGADGFEVLARLRSRLPGLPVIMVTARGSEEDRVQGLTHGADDYVVKPFSAKELLARVAAVLRRAPERPKGLASFGLGGRRIDLVARRATLPDGESVDLSERETELLAYLAGTGDRPVSREELLERVWGLDPKGLHTRTVDMHVARLRDKLADNRGDPQLLVTVHGAGYRLGAIEALPT